MANDNPVQAQDVQYVAGSLDKLANSVDDLPMFSFRDQVAMGIVIGLLSREDHTGLNPSFVVDTAYQVADLMIKKREVKGKGFSRGT